MTDDASWRRPEESTEDLPAGAAPDPGTPEHSGPPADRGASAYAGPPPSTPPPPQWRPSIVVQPPPPRPLPPQNAADIDRAEARARTLTYGVGLLAGAVVLVILCALCARIVF